MDFLFVDDKKKIELYPRATGLLPPIQMHILKRHCFVFTYHIRFNNFRLAICPSQSAETFYLDVELDRTLVAKIF